MQTILRQIVVSLFLLFLFAGASFAASSSLDAPLGLAVDSTGKLYVANYGGNNVLAYSPNYSQLKSKEITSNINGPVGLAFDPDGNLHVANVGNNSITEYSSSGAPLPYTITAGVNSPQFIAVDALGSVWVNNGIESINVYAQTGELGKTILPPVPNTQLYGIAVDQGYTFIGSSIGSIQAETLPLLESNSSPLTIYPGFNGAIACASPSTCYQAVSDGSVDAITMPGGVQVLVFLSAPAYGIAVDKTRGRLYLSVPTANQIVVYDINGNYLATIQ